MGSSPFYKLPSPPPTAIPISVVLAVLVSIAIAVLSRHILQHNRGRIRSAIWDRLRLADTTDDGHSGAMTRLLGLPAVAPQGIMASVAQGLKNSLPALAQSPAASPAGLGNINNSCFQNSVLQGLSALESMPAYLDAAGALDEEEADLGKTNTAVALRNFVDALRSPDNRGRVLWTPGRLKSMNTWQQQDAQEYYTKLLDEVEREVAKAALAPARGLEWGPAGVPSSSSSSMRSVDSGYYSTSLADAAEASCRAREFKSPLEGLLAQRVVCTRCRHTDGLDLIPFNFLTLNLPLNRDICYLNECFDAYTRVEEIEGVECAKCTLLKARDLLSRLIERHANSATPPIAMDEVHSRLQAIEVALEDQDFDWKTVHDKCNIATRNRVASTKTKQTVIARPPQSLVLHINRSVFDEMTGHMYKNTAAVGYEPAFDLGRWCIGSVSACLPENADLEPNGSMRGAVDTEEQWRVDPYSALNNASKVTESGGLISPMYTLRAVITHFGRHDNGHYVCYKRFGESDAPDNNDDSQEESRDGEEKESSDGEEKESSDGEPRCSWWRLSDETVTPVADKDMGIVEGGAFMLFYECAVPADDELAASAVREAAMAKMEMEMGKLRPVLLTPPRDETDSSPPSPEPQRTELVGPMTPESLGGVDEADTASVEVAQGASVDDGSAVEADTASAEVAQGASFHDSSAVSIDDTSTVSVGEVVILNSDGPSAEQVECIPDTSL